MTHFAIFADDAWRTLCGLAVDMFIDNERPPTCPQCLTAHGVGGWTFPLPPTVTAEA